MTAPAPTHSVLPTAIPGVAVQQLRTFADDRGFFREIIRASSPEFTGGFGQLSHSEVFPGVLKAWHAHRVQHQWTYVAHGTLLVALADTRAGSPTQGKVASFLAGRNAEAQLYGFPPGVLHGYLNVGQTAQVIYVTSGQYDLADEVRVDPYDPSVPFDWRASRAR